MPAMVHVSTACNPNFHTLGAHYLNADTSVFMQLLQGDLFQRFPKLRLRDPARRRRGALPLGSLPRPGDAQRLAGPRRSSCRNVFFDTCVYHQPGVDLLLDVLPTENVLFASEMLGAVRGADPDTGVEWDDTLVYVANAGLADGALADVLTNNALRVYPHLATRIPTAV